MAPRSLRQLPNTISAARIVSVPVLIVLAYQGREEPFKWLLLAALLSDILDGLLARSMHVITVLGSRLDSIGDTLLMVAAVYGIVVFHWSFIEANAAWVVFVLCLWALTVVLALWRYGRLASFHSVALRLGAVLFGVFVMYLFIFGYNALVFYIAIAVNIVAYLEVFLLIWLLPEWSPNTHGVYWVLKNRRNPAE